MALIKIIYIYILTSLAFFVIDIVWLGFVAQNFYDKYLSHLLSDKVNWPAAIIFYLIYIVGILVFAVFPAYNDESLFKAIVLGGLFGLVAYATYDLSNLATLKDWPLTVVLVDIIWGIVLTSSVSIAGFYITRFIA